MNQAYIIGKLGSDAELRYAQSGMAVVNISVATSEKNGENWESTWHRVVLFGKMAETMAPRLKKGSQVFVQGKIQNREYEKDGVKMKSSQIIAFLIKIIEKQSAPTDAYAGQNSGNFGEEIPF